MAFRKLRTNSESMGDRSSDDSFDFSIDGISEGSSTEDDEMPATAPGQQTESKRLQTTNSIGSVKRLPTRRPDPNTFNRNALMARENRKKKKEYMENLEKQVVCYKSINRKLKKLLKQQSKVVKRLKDESKYYRSVLANKTQIISLINAVKSAKAPDVAMGEESRIFAPFTCDDLCEDINRAGDYERLQEDIRNWDSLLDPNEVSFPAVTDMNTFRDSQKQVIGEHNYSNSCSEEDAEDSGVCLHVSSGKVSLKFCAVCHSKSTVGLETVF